MNNPRFLTREEACLVRSAAESWLRLADVEMNRASDAVALLARAELRKPSCRRQDIVTLDRAFALDLPDGRDLAHLTIVRPHDEDVTKGRVSLLGPIGLALIGQVAGSAVTLAGRRVKVVGNVGEPNRHDDEVMA